MWKGCISWENESSMHQPRVFVRSDTCAIVGTRCGDMKSESDSTVILYPRVAELDPLFVPWYDMALASIAPRTFASPRLLRFPLLHLRGRPLFELPALSRHREIFLQLSNRVKFARRPVDSIIDTEVLLHTRTLKVSLHISVKFLQELNKISH